MEAIIENKRSVNFNTEEIKLLIELVKKYKMVIESKSDAYVKHLHNNYLLTAPCFFVIFLRFVEV